MSSNREYRERNGERRARAPDQRSRPDSSSSRPPYYPRDSHHRSTQERDAPRGGRDESKCTHICSRRGIVLICAVLTNALVLICVIAAQMVVSGVSSMGGMGTFNINSDFNMQGTELQQARDLDVQYSQMRAPCVYGGIPFSLAFGVVSLLFVVAGNKPTYLMSQKLLMGQMVFQAVGAVAYVVAVGLYIHFVITVNSTDVCKQRAILYARRGYTWMNCDVSGGDAAVALFGLVTAILYTAGAVLTFQTIRGVRRYLEERDRRAAEEATPQRSAQSAPLKAETTFV